ncbi:50S ribosomal protein L9 [Patescibacteria group bacterium]|nr:MAG: 50S ribosomal protein L9 [Patescibacteria group bacterium]
MKIIFLKDVPKKGKKYEVKDISDGYALNFLIPNRLAEAATKDAVKRVEMIQSQDMTVRKVREDLLLKSLQKISESSITISGKANEKGHLFAGVHTVEIVAEVKKSLHLELDPEFIILPKPIKEVGEYKIEIKVQDKSAVLKVVIQKV